MAAAVLYRLLLAFVFVYFANCSVKHEDSFSEELFIKPLPSGHVYTYFIFTTKWNVTSKYDFNLNHFRLFPLSLGEIISQSQVEELHLSLTQGKWHHHKWGYPFQEAPPGTQLWAWFSESTTDVSASWQNLTNSLSGQFCVSLNFIDSAVTLVPKFSFRQQGHVRSSNSSFLRYAALPRESVCTENLTPWKKLLPCESKAGLSTLLQALQIFSTNYLSLSVDFKTVYEGGDIDKSYLQLQLSISLVFEPPVTQVGKQDWSFVKLFGSSLSTVCPLSSHSAVYVDLSNNQTVGTFRLTPDPTDTMSLELGEKVYRYAVYDLFKAMPNGRINVAGNYDKHHVYWIIPPPPIHGTRYIQGYGLENGGIITRIYNNHPVLPLKIVYFDIIPWFLRIYLHTLKIVSKGSILKPDHIFYEAACDRLRPHHMEILLTLPPASETSISFEFERAFLKWTEYPPDANHGFYIGSAIISTVLNQPVVNYTGDVSYGHTIYQSLQSRNIQKQHFLRLYTETLLVSLPTPDFSMPYNVICLACTVVALAFGPIHNITTKALTAIEPKAQESTLSSIKKKLKLTLNKVLKRKTCEDTSEAQEASGETESKKDK